MDEKATIEPKLVNFVRSRTAAIVNVDLSQPSTAVIKQIEQGSTCLRNFWMTVLQHHNNYPEKRYPYKRIDDKRGDYTVLLKVDDVTISVFSNGTLMIQGSSALDWILKRFSRIMDEYPLEPQPISDGLEHEKNLNDLTRKDKEKQADTTGTNQTVDDKREESEGVQKGETTVVTQNPVVDDVSDDLGLPSLDLWTGQVLSQELSHLKTPVIRDGPTYIYKLWKSLLSYWLLDHERKVYLATPFLDTQRMVDIGKLVLQNFTTANIDAFYVRIKCNYDEKISDVKENAQNEFPEEQRLNIKNKLYDRIVYPLSTFHAKFIGCTDGMGGAEVLVTSANFTADHFKHHNLESVVFHKMSEANFTQEFILPLSASQKC
uniref:Uncharacterized protein LOC111103887 n=1 Tax=Crassostrea virginica TaxID=6565 RepID=A0A8B8ANR1_CRAVI|nr:uncharacterized protein LOC111103887 [Crassostrea virginica]